MSKMIPPIPAGTFVGVQNCFGVYRLIRRRAPGFYEVDFKGTVVLMPRRNLIHPVPPGRHYLGGTDNTVEVK